MTLTHNADHVAHGLDALIYDLRRPKLQALASSYLTEAQAIEDALWTLYIDTMIGDAFGAALDQLGGLVGQSREGRDDATYKPWILARILVNRSSGTPQQLINIAKAVSVPSLRLEEQYPAAAVLHSDVSFAAATGTQVAKLLHAAKPAGVALFFHWYDGVPFRFAAGDTVDAASPYGFNTGVWSAISDGVDAVRFFVPLPLDRLPAPAAAWSVSERLSAYYDGPLFRLRRSSDDTEHDIRADAAGKCDEAQIIALCSSPPCVGTVSVWYDQSGHGRDLIRPTVPGSRTQPAVYDLSPGGYGPYFMVKQGANVAMNFDGAGPLTRADGCGLTGNAAFTISALWTPSDLYMGAVPYGGSTAYGPYGSATVIPQNLIVLDPLEVGSQPVAYAQFYNETGRVVDQGLELRLFQYAVNEVDYGVTEARVTAGSLTSHVIMHERDAPLRDSTVLQNGVPLPRGSQSSNHGDVTAVLANTGTSVGTGTYAPLSTLVLLPYVPSDTQLTTLTAWLESRRAA